MKPLYVLMGTFFFMIFLIIAISFAQIFPGLNTFENQIGQIAFILLAVTAFIGGFIVR